MHTKINDFNINLRVNLKSYCINISLSWSDICIEYLQLLFNYTSYETRKILNSNMTIKIQ